MKDWLPVPIALLLFLAVLIGRTPGRSADPPAPPAVPSHEETTPGRVFVPLRQEMEEAEPRADEPPPEPLGVRMDRAKDPSELDRVLLDAWTKGDTRDIPILRERLDPQRPVRSAVILQALHRLLLRIGREQDVGMAARLCEELLRDSSLSDATHLILASAWIRGRTVEQVASEIVLGDYPVQVRQRAEVWIAQHRRNP